MSAAVYYPIEVEHLSYLRRMLVATPAIRIHMLVLNIPATDMHLEIMLNLHLQIAPSW